MNKLTILGSSGTMPTIKRGMPSTALLYKGKLMLFDCGEGTQRQMMKYKVHFGRVKYIFISHMHLDHYLGMFGLIETLKMNDRTETLEIYVPKGAGSKLQTIIKVPDFVKLIEYGQNKKLLETPEFTIEHFKLDHNTTNHGFVFESKPKKKFEEAKAKGMGIQGPMFKEIADKGKLKVNGKMIKFKDVGWIEKGFKIVYATDTRPTKETIRACKNADYLIHDSLTLDEDKENAVESKHSTAKEAAQIAKKANVKMLILYHISPKYKTTNDLEKEAKKIFKNTVSASDGLTFKFA